MRPIAKAVLHTAPAVLAVDLTALKSFLKIDGSSEDAMVTAIAQAAIERLEAYTALKFINQKWTIYYDSFGFVPSKEWWDGERDGAIGSLSSSSKFLDLPFGKAQSITTFNTYGEDDVAVEFASTNWQLDTVSMRPRVALKTSAVWPTTVLRPMNGVELLGVQFGFGSSYTSVPDAIQQAIKITVAKLYENRGDSPNAEFFAMSGFTIPNTAQVLLNPYVQYRI